jgi:hypothetical protein
MFARCVTVTLAAGILFMTGIAGNDVKRKTFSEVKLPTEESAPVGRDVRTAPPPDFSGMRPLAGTYTGLSGFFDYQVNAGACQYIRLDPSDPTGNKIHVIFMTASDSAAPTGPTRRTNYAYSSNGGVTWQNFNNIEVPQGRRSGYPSLDMLQGTTAGTIVANHNVVSTDLVSVVYVDAPPGTGAFSELSPAGSIAPGDEPIWPFVAGAADGSIIMSASRSTASTGHYTRTTDFATWAPWGTTTPAAVAGLPTKANGTGRVAILLNPSFAAVDDGLYYLQSTDNGATWPAQATRFMTDGRVVGPDTFYHTLGSDCVYQGNNLLVAFTEINGGTNVPTDSAQISFWSQATGIVVAASKVNTPNVAPFENRPTLNTVTMDMPSIGVSGNTIVIAYHAMINNDTSANGYNCSDIFMVYSTNLGVSWSTPRNLTNTRGLDERFVSVAPWNEPGFVNLVWQEDPEAGGNIIGDPGAIPRRTRQVFLKTSIITDVRLEETVPSAFKLDQNYPNPFNPATKIRYSIPVGTDVTLKVYNTLGQEVATLVNDYRPAGTYEADFFGSELPSGVYFYRLSAGSFTQTKRMMLVK